MKKKLFFVVAMILMVALVAGCAKQQPAAPAPEPEKPAAEAPAAEAPAAPAEDALIKVGLVVCHMTDEWTVGSYSLMQEEANSRGFDIVKFVDSDWDLKKEAEGLDTLLPMDLDMLVIQPVDENATGQNVQPFIDKGVPVLSIGISLVNDAKAGFVGWDTFGSGYMIGEDALNYINGELGGKANVLFLSYPVENTIQAGTDFDVVWAAFTSGGLGGVTALEAANHKARLWCTGGYGEELFDIFKSGNKWYMADYVVFPRVYVDTIFEAMDKVAAGNTNLGDVYSPFPVMNQQNYKELLGL